MGEIVYKPCGDTFHERLDDALWHARMRPYELASSLGVTNQVVYNWRHGLRMPRKTRRPEIARLLGCDEAVLFELS